MGTPGSCKGFCPLLSCGAGRCGQWVNGDPQIALDGPGSGRSKTQGSESTLWSIDSQGADTQPGGHLGGGHWERAQGITQPKRWEATQSNPQGSRP